MAERAGRRSGGADASSTRLTGVVALGTFLAALGGCSTSPAVPGEAAVEAAPPGSSVLDACDPEVVPDFEDAPDAVCAKRSEEVVADLLPPDDDLPAESATPATLAGTQRVAAAAVRPSCAPGRGGGIDTCGIDGGDDCCRTAPVPAGTAGRIRIKTGFELGVYEVTVGRVQAFVAAVGGNVRQAAAALPDFNPKLAASLPASRAEVDRALGPACQFRSVVEAYGARTWPSAELESAVAALVPGADARAVDIRADATAERLLRKPVNCVSYAMAAAFCAWDGGRLPTNDEWRYAALGGSERRPYPWGSDYGPERLVTEIRYQHTYPEDFPWGGNGQNAYHIAPPGKKPQGVARWGHLDMGGNLLEWMADVTGKEQGIVRGGSWEGHDDRNSEAYVNYPFDRTYGSLGMRCAYGGTPAVQPPVPEPATLVPVHVAYNAAAKDHLLTRTEGEGAPGWTSQGVGFRVRGMGGDGADVGLYRCRMNGTGAAHFASNDAACEGHVVEGLLGYVYRTSVPGSKLLYRCHDGAYDHYTTTQTKECTRAGFRIEGSQGYVMP